ncbi:hypothetical protein M0Q50_09600 [bacterium]|jgi:hypothetical protein|nr:hypothetical protein [bacterium]
MKKLVRETLNEIFLNDESHSELPLTTLKKVTLDWVEKHPGATWKEIHGYMLVIQGLDPDDIDNRGRYSSYFSGHSDYMAHVKFGKDFESLPINKRTVDTHGLLMRPTKNDPRYLRKEGKGYVVDIYE